MSEDERVRLTKTEDRSKCNMHRIDKLEQQQKNMLELVRSVSQIAQKQADMDTDLKEIKSDIKTISLKPARRWDSIVEKVILAAVGVLVAYMAVKLGFM